MNQQKEQFQPLQICYIISSQNMLTQKLHAREKNNTNIK